MRKILRVFGFVVPVFVPNKNCGKRQACNANNSQKDNSVNHSLFKSLYIKIPVTIKDIARKTASTIAIVVITRLCVVKLPTIHASKDPNRTIAKLNIFFRKPISSVIRFSFICNVVFRMNLVTIILIMQANIAQAKTCTGRMINPISDICWECIFPITIGKMPVVSGQKPDTDNPSNPICICNGKIAGLPQVGISIGLWEGIRLVDVTKAPFCFVNLGGMEIGKGITSVGSGKDPKSSNDSTSAVWHSHFYIYPIGFLLQNILDMVCLEASTFDVGWISELDPLWQDDQMTFLLNPEAILFGNVITQSACGFDCMKASVSTPTDALFWCSGCQGSMYPLNGRVQAHQTSLQSSLLVTSRMLYKLHRQLMLPITSGQEALCQPIPAPIIKKSQYRTQMINPLPAPDSFFGCQQLGKASIIYETGREFPIKGEDFGFMIWRKRNCCLL